MKSLQIDALKVKWLPFLPVSVKAADGKRYKVIGVVTETTSCSYPVEGEAGEVAGRRLQVLLGEEILLVEEVPAGPPARKQGEGKLKVSKEVADYIETSLQDGTAKEGHASGSGSEPWRESTQGPEDKQVAANREFWTKNVSEKAFQKHILLLAKALGWKVAHFRPARTKDGGWMTAVAADGAGFPDLLFIRGQKVFVAELKVGKNKPTLKQLDWLCAFREADVAAYTWRPTDMPEIEKVLA